MNTEQQRAAFKAWLSVKPCGAAHDFAWEAWQASLESPEVQALRKDAERYRWLITTLQQVYDGDYFDCFETGSMSFYCHMLGQFKGDRVVRAEITWRDKTDEPIGLSEAIDQARRAEGDTNATV